MWINETDKSNISQLSKDQLVKVIESYTVLDKKGTSLVGKCPSCSADRGLTVNPNKKVYKCFKCNNISGDSGVKFAMQFANLSFVDALVDVARILGISIEEPQSVEPKNKKGDNKRPYIDKFLKESGLTGKDVVAKIYAQDTNKTVTVSQVFKKGSIDYIGNIDPRGDDVIIEYYDLDGLPVKYEHFIKKKSHGFKEFYRVRYQFPDEHKDKYGKAVKYRSPIGGGSPIYIPQSVRDKYHNKESIETLYIQEGEKKAEKACKHGITSIAISGVQNFASYGKLSEDFIRIVERCNVRNVVMIYDSDWNDISHDIKVNDPVDRRPRSFFWAARNFKEYIRSLRNRNLRVDTIIGAIRKNASGDKGLDDLLANTLKGRESDLQIDIDRSMNEKDMVGDYIHLYKISSWSDLRLEELWSLHNAQAFATEHFEELKHYPDFKMGRHIWKFADDGTIVSSQPFDDDEKFWKEDKRVDRYENEKINYSFYYVNCITFLQNRGFARFRKQDGVSYMFVKYEKPFLKEVDNVYIRDYVMDFAKTFANRDVQNLLIQGGVQFLGPEKLSHLEYMTPIFESPNKSSQLFYFKTNCWEVRHDLVKQVDYQSVDHTLWLDQRQDYDVDRISQLMNVSRIDDTDNFAVTVNNHDCQMLQFLINTSNYTWRKEISGSVSISADEIQDNTNHLISKLCAIGYLSMSYKDKSVTRMVVSMDGRQSEIGQSNGRSGKSLIGEMLRYVKPTLFINGKGKAPDDDQFFWAGVDEKTQAVFIDDVPVNFRVEPLFPYISGDFVVNDKGEKRTVYPYHRSPKLYLTTNHALNGSGSSFRDRQWKIAFSDFYNDQHKPVDDFGGQLFDDWDAHQWNLFWNLIAECVQLYLRFGVVQAPLDRIEARQLRQIMSEDFLAWAEEYYSDPSHINRMIHRKTLYDECIKYTNSSPKYLTPNSFKNRIKAYCQWKGLIFNPGRLDAITREPMFFDKDGRPDLDHKAGGIEYFTLGTEDFFTANKTSIDNEPAYPMKYEKPDRPFPFED